MEDCSCDPSKPLVSQNQCANHQETSFQASWILSGDIFIASNKQFKVQCVGLPASGGSWFETVGGGWRNFMPQRWNWNFL